MWLISLVSFYLRLSRIAPILDCTCIPPYIEIDPTPYLVLLPNNNITITGIDGNEYEHIKPIRAA
jgi:hypothetical protein